MGEIALGYDNVLVDNEEFELIVDHNTIKWWDVMHDVGDERYFPGEYHYHGPEFRGKWKCRVKFVQLGYVPTFEEVRRRVEEMGGRLLEGQAQRAFRQKYPWPYIGGRFAFGGSFWGDRYGSPCIVVLHGAIPKCIRKWDLSFKDVAGGFLEDVRWAVVVKEEAIVP